MTFLLTNMKTYDRLKSLLKDHVWFRERKNRLIGISKLLKKQYNVEIDDKMLADLICEAQSMDRAWRKVLEENPELQGSDYGDKEKLEQRTQINLGYEPLIKLNIK